MEQHCSHYGDVEFSERCRQIVSIAILHFGFGLQGGVTEPVGILQLLHHVKKPLAGPISKTR